MGLLESIKRVLHTKESHTSIAPNVPEENQTDTSLSRTEQSAETHSTADITRYFKRLLERSQLEPVDFGDEKFLKLPMSALEQGVLSTEVTDQIFGLADERTLKKSEDSLEIVISLVTYSPRTQGNHQGLLLLSAHVDREGRLQAQVDPGKSPWIPSERLTMAGVQDLEVMAGSLQRFGRYTVRQEKADKAESQEFSSALKVARNMFKAVATVPISDFSSRMECDGYTIEIDECFIKPYNKISAAGTLIELDDYLLENSIPALYERMILGAPGSRTPDSQIDAEPRSLLASALSACGSMSDDFPLTKSQRIAVHAFLSGEDGDVTAVSGPPGTGKTTMLQSIVANLITKRALERADAPLIVGMSTNNQAVTNIIESFGSVTKAEHGQLDFRWLPKAQTVREKDTSARSSESNLNVEAVAESAPVGESIPGLAAYCPSKAKMQAAKRKYLVEQRDKSGVYTDYSEPAYLAGAREFFLKAAARVFPVATSPSTAKAEIHAKLTEIDKMRRALLEAMYAGDQAGYQAAFARLAHHPVLTEALVKLADLKDCGSLEQLDQKLDVTLRYAEFWLAVHYYEACWLELGNANAFIPKEERYKSLASYAERYWKQAPLLTPCFVMTCFQVPKYFKLFSRPGENLQFDVSRIDLLIVDESGQVDTPVGIPSFALAKRALVVGDEKQLSPIWSVDPQTDQDEAGALGFSPYFWVNCLQSRGLTGSEKSSLMKAAAFASRFSFGHGQPGLFLSEHFRCHQQIIGFCNDLLYDGLLKPNRSLKGYKLADITDIPDPFLFHEVPGSVDLRSGSSRKNDVEAEAIAQWIVDNFAFFFDLYNTQEPDSNKKVAAENLIGVVTPFSAQAANISEKLEELAKKYAGKSGAPEDLAKKITVGTAHRLQGAERPIVLFSAVYGENTPAASFIDSNLELMNVAVSRAKDLIIVFAAANRWGSGEVFSKMANFAVRPPVASATAVDAMVEAPDSQSVAADHSHRISGDASDTKAANFRALTERSPSQTVTQSQSLSKVIFSWKRKGLFASSEAELDTSAWNLRLSAAGWLSGRPGLWEPTDVALKHGVVIVKRTNKDGTNYQSIEYSPAAAAFLEELYKAGKL
ncbi:MAG: AAA domain-containing protein [Arcanobacterium sp.]|nr:AAA domain-containing protein [Arcanobacterium sp.]